MAIWIGRTSIPWYFLRCCTTHIFVILVILIVPRLKAKIAKTSEALEKIQDDLQDVYSEGAVEGYSKLYLGDELLSACSCRQQCEIRSGFSL